MVTTYRHTEHQSRLTIDPLTAELEARWYELGRRARAETRTHFGPTRTAPADISEAAERGNVVTTTAQRMMIPWRPNGFGKRSKGATMPRPPSFTTKPPSKAIPMPNSSSLVGFSPV
jgi:hypothetical protein